MGEVNFYLKKAEATTGKSLIVLYKRYNGKRLVFSTGQTINKKAWNSNKQRVKSNDTTTADGTQHLNDFLTGLDKKCEAVYNKSLVNGSPSPEILKQSLRNYINKIDDKPEFKGDFFKLVDRFISGEIKHGDNIDKSPNTLQNYNTVKGHLRAYEIKQKIKLTFESINLDFFYTYVSFLKSINLATNTIAKDITVLKTFMNEAVDLGFTTNIQFRHKKFYVKEKKTDAVYLNESELLKLYRHDFSKNKRLEQAIHIFLVGAYTGLRFSDYSNIKAENIVQKDNETYLKIITQKTKFLYEFQCDPIVLEIFKKYDHSPNKLPKSISIQRFNDYIKEACKLAGLTEKGRLSTDLNLELWQCVSSHTARRSFATNLYRQGFDTLLLRKITGHSSESSFFKYIKINNEDASKGLIDHRKKRLSEKMLRIA
ncbi:MAG: tyrosine-type recombinase/integrase [Chitinophagaceae bacterium]